MAGTARYYKMKKTRDYSEFYQQITGRIRKNDAACSLLNAAGRAATGVMYVFYPLLLLLLAGQGKIRGLICTVIVPGTSFVLLSLIRARINRPRPYETWEIVPLISRDGRGESMPSRHVFSSALIAALWLPVCRPVGAALLLTAAVAAVIRVLGGVHYPSDVAAGYITGLVAGLLTLICYTFFSAG